MLTSVRRGLLLVYGAMVFGDTSVNVDEVTSPRFFYVLIKRITINLKHINHEKITIISIIHSYLFTNVFEHIALGRDVK